MKLKALLGDDFAAIAPVAGDGTIQVWKAAIWAGAGWAWSQVWAAVLAAWVNQTLRIVTLLWVADMLSGIAASWKCGFRDEKGNLVAGVDGKPLTGLKSWSQKKCVQGAQRLVWVWWPLIWGADELLSYTGPGQALKIAAGTTHVYVIMALFLSFSKNLFRIAGDARGLRMTEVAEDKVDQGFGIVTTKSQVVTTVSKEEIKVEPRA